MSGIKGTVIGAAVVEITLKRSCGVDGSKVIFSGCMVFNSHPFRNSVNCLISSSKSICALIMEDSVVCN